MLTRKSFTKIAFVVVFLIAGVVGYFLLNLALEHIQKSSEQASNPPLPGYAGALSQVAAWLPDGGWGEPIKKTENTIYGELSGYSTEGFVILQTPMLDHFEDSDALEKMGYMNDVNLQADGPGSSTWGYKREIEGRQQVLVFSYETLPTGGNPEEPLQFMCPCKIDVSAFVSEPFTLDAQREF